MSSPIRTALVGVGVIAICFALASLKGHHLLLSFAACGLLFGVRAWLHLHSAHNAEKNAGNSRQGSVSQSSKIVAGLSQNNVYQFPSQEMRAYDLGS